MTADAHLDEHTSAEVYQQTLANIRADAPDFHIDLGNLFMTDKHATRDEAWRQYLAQRYYLNQLGAPLFLALGVHDGEASRYDDGSPNSLAVQSNAARKRYFPNPEPDNFYTGDATRHAQSGLLENYYAWTWGDALFVVLDPYRYSLRSGGRNSDGWSWSLGREQYDWLARTLATSQAKYKFIFIHNLLAGDQASRGGVEIAKFNEWGGKNFDGTDGFAQHRPGWPMPVHQLLLKNHVTAVFRAHDNFYARQELDGIPYIMIPQPSFAGDDRIRDLQNYGYKQGVFRGNAGHVRVTVSPKKLVVNYVKSLPDAPVADNYLIVAH
jgi:Calcineurin-like phosphoesterase